MQPTEFLGNEKIESVKFSYTNGNELTDCEIKADVVIMAFGFKPSDIPWLKKNNVSVNDYNQIVVSANSKYQFQTTNPKIFAGGDIVRGSDLVVTAIDEGRKAAAGILDYLGL